MYYDAKVVKSCKNAIAKAFLLTISALRLNYRHSTSPESPTIVHIGVRYRNEMYRLHLLLMPKSSQTSLTRFLAESGADTRERNRLLRRGSLTHVSDFTAQSPCSPCTFRKRKTRFCESES